MLNGWWENTHIPEEVLRAKVVLIFKKGDKEDISNYRPISLLNNAYKIMAAITQKRLSDKIDEHMQHTQYGFRKNRGTADAIHYIRRIIDKGESRQGTTLIALLAKAFDKVGQEKLIEALRRMNIPEKICNLIKAFYTNPTFCVEMDGKNQGGTHRRQA